MKKIILAFSVLLLGGCGVIQNPVGIPERVLGPNALACVQGTGPMPQNWVALILPEGYRDGGKLAVKNGCQMEFVKE